MLVEDIYKAKVLVEDIYKAKALLKSSISMLLEMMMLDDGYAIAIN